MVKNRVYSSTIAIEGKRPLYRIGLNSGFKERWRFLDKEQVGEVG